MKLDNKVRNLFACLATEKRTAMLGFILDDEFRRLREFVRLSEELGFQLKDPGSTLRRVFEPFNMAESIPFDLGRNRCTNKWRLSNFGENIGKYAARYSMKLAVENNYDISNIFGNNIKFPYTSAFHRLVILDQVFKNKVMTNFGLKREVAKHNSDVEIDVYEHLVALHSQGLIEYYKHNVNFRYKLNCSLDDFNPLSWKVPSTYRVAKYLIQKSHTMEEIKNKTKLDQATISSILSHLKNQGAVTEEKDRDSLNRSKITMKSKGKEFYSHYSEIVAAVNDKDALWNLKYESKMDIETTRDYLTEFMI